MLTFSRLVYARMRRSTLRHASVPLLTKRTISTLGTRSITFFASTFCCYLRKQQQQQTVDSSVLVSA
jgi:hypothetical protein